MIYRMIENYLEEAETSETDYFICGSGDYDIISIFEIETQLKCKCDT